LAVATSGCKDDGDKFGIHVAFLNMF
jgi:hypothetical protein